ADLEPRDGVGFRTLAEQEVAVGLDHVRVERHWWDVDHPAVDRPRTIADGDLEQEVAARLGTPMRLERLMIEMLGAVAEADAENVCLAADAVEHHLPPHLLEAGAEGDPHEAELCVRVEHGALQGDVPDALAP